MFSAVVEIGPNLLQILTAFVTVLILLVRTRSNSELRSNGGNSTKDKIDEIYERLSNEDTTSSNDIAGK